jgi:hypothetical protein
MVTEMGDLNSELFARLQECCAGFNLNGVPIYSEGNHKAHKIFYA